MNFFEKLYDEHEDVKVRFVGFTTEAVRYDFGIVYTNMFFGKTLVVCMQTGRSSLLDSSDISNVDHLVEVFKLDSKDEATELVSFFEDTIPSHILETQYD